MRRIAVLAVFLTACGEPSASGPKEATPPPAEDDAETCLKLARAGLPSCLEGAKTPSEAHICGATASAKIHVCERVYLGKDPTKIEWTALSDYEWVGNPKVPQTEIQCPNELYGQGWVRLRQEESLGTICVRNNLTGEVY